MELADLHHPDCKMSRQNSEQRERERSECERSAGAGPSGGSDDPATAERPPVRELDTSDALLLTPEAYKATEAVEFIAKHLRNEDEYTQVNMLIICK